MLAYASGHRHGPVCKGQQAKKYSTDGEHHDGHGTGCRAHKGGVLNMLEGQGHFPKGGGPEQSLPRYIEAGWVRCSGVVVSVAPRIAVLSRGALERCLTSFTGFLYWGGGGR